MRGRRGHERGGEVQGPLCQVSGSGGPSAGRVFAGGLIPRRWRCSEGILVAEQYPVSHADIGGFALQAQLSISARVALTESASFSISLALRR